MCGIAGWLAPPGRPVDVEALRRVSARIAHRGPDGEGEFFDQEAGLGLAHRRLAILDLSPGNAQPMVDEARGVVLVFNGEIYNHRELRRNLESAGESFRTTGDTEVVLRAIAVWGEAAFTRLAGMFALAVWHRRSRRLWLARDATGMKPLYLAESPDRGLLFASELKALLAVTGFEATVDRWSLRQYLEFGYTFLGDSTILRGVTKLLPGEVVEAAEGRIVRRWRHFRPPVADPADRRGVDERIDELDETLGRVVREHLVADVPVGLLLSGGLDSSLVAAYAARETELTTVTMAFGRSAIDEREPARQVATALGTRHVEIEIDPREVLASMEDDAAVFDDLFGDWGTVSTRAVYRRFRELGFKVALVGEGADELLAGYPVFRFASGRTGLFPLARLYRRYSGRRWGRLFGPFRDVMEGIAGEVDRDLFEAVRRFELVHQLPNQYVMKVDKASMSVSLEARAPWLDRRIVELALRTPRDLLLKEGENKWLARELARRRALLPVEISGREKFGAPIATSWLDDVPEFRLRARDLVLGSAWCDELGLRRAMEAYFGGRSGYRFPHPLSIFRNLAWRLLLLELWSAALGVTRRAA